jgi:hypothetical protein
MGGRIYPADFVAIACFTLALSFLKLVYSDKIAYALPAPDPWFPIRDEAEEMGRNQ